MKRFLTRHFCFQTRYSCLRLPTKPVRLPTLLFTRGGLFIGCFERLTEGARCLPDLLFNLLLNSFRRFAVCMRRSELFQLGFKLFTFPFGLEALFHNSLKLSFGH